MPATVGTPLLWGACTLFVLCLLALDLGVFHRKAHAVGPREAVGWSLFWIALALLFNAGVVWWFGAQRGLEFLTGYLIEKALSVDSIFIFLVIFSYFSLRCAPAARGTRRCPRRGPRCSSSSAATFRWSLPTRARASSSAPAAG